MSKRAQKGRWVSAQDVIPGDEPAPEPPEEGRVVRRSFAHISEATLTKIVQWARLRPYFLLNPFEPEEWRRNFSAGLFVRRFLLTFGEGYPYLLHRAWVALNAPRETMSYANFRIIIYRLKNLGLIEPSRPTKNFEKTFYRLPKALEVRPGKQRTINLLYHFGWINPQILYKQRFEFVAPARVPKGKKPKKRRVLKTMTDDEYDRFIADKFEEWRKNEMDFLFKQKANAKALAEVEAESQKLVEELKEELKKHGIEDQSA